MAPASPRTVPHHTVHLVAHGSPDPRHAASLRRLAGRLAGRLPAQVTVSFLAHDEPRTHDSLLVPRCGPAAWPATVVVPLLLSAGTHWHRDLPPVVSGPGLGRATLLAPPRPDQFADAVVSLARPEQPGAPGGAGCVVLALAGSEHAGAAERAQRLADRVRERGGSIGWEAVAVAQRPADVARWAGPGALVVPILVADGVFADRIRGAAAQAGADVTPVLGGTRHFAATLARLIAAALPDPAPEPPTAAPDASASESGRGGRAELPVELLEAALS